MNKQLQVYRCSLCGNVVEILHAGGGQLICCGQAMTLLNENTTDAATEKHVPVVEKTATGIKVTVGSVAHPMEADHYIQWIEAIVDGKSYIQLLEPGQAPEAEFPIQGDDIIVREFCNKHGLWKA
jgi:superoxide reductase